MPDAQRPPRAPSAEERPRDRLGRPLPPDADPGLVAPPVPKDLPDAAATLAAAEQAFADGLPFHAHELLEERWRRTSGAEREVWRALAQFAAGVTHAARGNRAGAAALHERAQRALTSLQPWPPALPWDRATTLRWCERHSAGA